MLIYVLPLWQSRAVLAFAGVEPITAIVVMTRTGAPQTLSPVHFIRPAVLSAQRLPLFKWSPRENLFPTNFFVLSSTFTLFAMLFRFIILLTAILATALASPGIWVAEDGSQLIGSTRLTCRHFSLATYAARSLSCDGCRCAEDVFLSAKNASVQFDHTLSTVTVNGVRHQIPGIQNAGGCESNQIKAYVLVCDEAPVTYRVRGFEDYVCTDMPKQCLTAGK